MFDFLFGWLKASKCKKVIKIARCRLKLLKTKRLLAARQLRQDVAELIKNGHQHIAVNRVEQVIKDESLAAAYELLDYFCEFILTRLSHIRGHKDCPNDINEAVSSVIFASARCGDVPELCAIGKLCEQRYGEKFTTTAVELLPGNLVNHQLKENLLVKSVPDDLKCRLVDEIARDFCLQTKPLAIEYYPDWQYVQVKENKDNSEVSEREPEKRTRRRSRSLEKQGIMDIGCMLYYHKPCRSISADHNRGAHYSRKHQKLPRKGTPESSSSPKKLKRHSSSGGTKRRTSFISKMNGCRLDHPCYFCAYDCNMCLRNLPTNPKRGIIGKHIQQKVLLGECCHWNEKLYEPQRPDRSENGAVVYNVFTYPDCQIEEHNETKAEASECMGRFASSEVANNCKDKMLRTYSCPPRPKHVHPKLPDYDDLAARFIDLKRECLENPKIAVAIYN